MANLYSTKTNDNLDSCNNNDYLMTGESDNSTSFNPVDASSEDFLFSFEETATFTDELVDSTDKYMTASSDNLTGTDGVLSATGTSSYGEPAWGTPNVWGTPINDAEYWRQQQGDSTCTVVAQMSIYESITGEYIDEYTAAEYAKDQGWFDPEEGTSVAYTGSLLNSLGIETMQFSNADVTTIIDALNSGDKIMASIDANEIWNPMYDTTGNPYEQTGTRGHTVWVTGVEWNSDNTADFYLNDSGTSAGQMETVDYYDFMNAWGDYDNLLTVVDV